MAPPNTITNTFSVDVEDYFHVTAFADVVDPERWHHYECRVVPNTERLLHLLDRHQVRATFFVLGWVAERYPGLVKAIARSGHEIGCHSHRHRLVYRMTPDEFRADLRRSTDVLEQIVGEKIVAYRAPSFSITARSQWALDILVEEGIRFDSSIFPIHHDAYGIPDAEMSPHLIVRERGTLWEFPPAVHLLWKLRVPVAGGGYFRLLPRRVSLNWLAGINRRRGEPFMFYIHPWELDPDQPRLPARWRSRFRHYQNLSRTESKLEGLLSRFSFQPFSHVFARKSGMN